MSNREIREPLLDLTQAVTMHANLIMMASVVESTITSRFRDLVREECYMDMLHDDDLSYTHDVCTVN